MQRCLIKTHQSPSAGILEESKGPVFELVCTWKLKQVQSKCQFEVRLIKEQKRKTALFLVKNLSCCQVCFPAPLPGAVIFPWLSPAESQSAEIFHGWRVEHTPVLGAQVGLKMRQAGGEHWADHPALLTSRVVGAATPPAGAARNTCCTDLAEKCGPKTQCRMGHIKTDFKGIVSLLEKLLAPKQELLLSFCKRKQ